MSQVHLLVINAIANNYYISIGKYQSILITCPYGHSCFNNSYEIAVVVTLPVGKSTPGGYILSGFMYINLQCTYGVQTSAKVAKYLLIVVFIGTLISGEH